MFSQKCFCSWERNCAEDGNFLCDIGWRRTNQSTALLSVQQGKDDYQTAKQTKLYHATAGSSLAKTPPFLFLLLVEGCETDEVFNRDVSVELLQGSLPISVSCLVTWLPEGSWCPFGCGVGVQALCGEAPQQPWRRSGCAALPCCASARENRGHPSCCSCLRAL